MPHLHISLHVVSGHKNDPIGVLTKLGWVILARKSTAYKKVSSNSIISSHNTLENLGRRLLWGSCKKRSTIAATKWETCVRHFRINLYKINYTVGLLWKKKSHTYRTTEILPFQEWSLLKINSKGTQHWNLNLKKPSKII